VRRLIGRLFGLTSWETDWQPVKQCWETGFFSSRAYVETETALYTVSDGYGYAWNCKHVRVGRLLGGARMLFNDAGKARPIRHEVRARG